MEFGRTTAWALHGSAARPLGRRAGPRWRAPPHQAEEEEPPGRCIARRVFDRFEALGRERPLSATQQRHVQHLVRTYRFRNEAAGGALGVLCMRACAHA